MIKKFTIKKESELTDVAKYVSDNLKYKIILLLGDMGSGKTTFVKYLMKEIINYDAVNSPTFSLVNEYSTDQPELVYHMDLYRLETIEEALNIGIEEYLESGHINLIEWPQLIEPIIPKESHKIEIALLETGERTISFS